MSALADAGIEQVVLVVGPAPDPIRAHFTTSPPRRVTMAYAEQPVPIGTADAVVRAAAVVNEPAFLVLNADNYYPVAAYAALAAESRAGTVAFDRDVLVRDGNIDADRVRAYAVLDVGDDETLRGIVEKPGDHLDIDSEAARWSGYEFVGDHTADRRRLPACSAVCTRRVRATRSGGTRPPRGRGYPPFA